MNDVHGIAVDYSRDFLFDTLGVLRLKESYMRDDEVSPQERFAFVSKAFGTDEAHAQRLYDYSSKHWLSYSTPILSFGRSARGLPISCFLPYLDDSSAGLVNTLSEVNWLSMLGGGVGIGIGIRASDDKSVGVMPHLRTYDASSLAYRQGRTRRGSYAAYLDISHPDILLFLEMRKPTGDPNMRTQNLHHGINITDEFMQLVERSMIDKDADDSWNLVDPHNNEVREVVSARELWQRVLDMRMQTGEPYLHFIDTSNKHMPEFQKKLGLKIRQSNLCSEIILPTDKDRTAVCCLSSVNLSTLMSGNLINYFCGTLRRCLTMFFSILLIMLLPPLSVQGILPYVSALLVSVLWAFMLTYNEITHPSSQPWLSAETDKSLNT
jgi:ribonucleoside-diphosphate reductase alpha chain